MIMKKEAHHPDHPMKKVKNKGLMQNNESRCR